MKTSTLLTLTITACLLVLLQGCKFKQEVEADEQQTIARPAKIVSLSKSITTLERIYPGILEATEKADLAFRVSGQLIELPAQAGLEVRAGDMLARLDPTDYQNTLAERQARYDLARTQLNQATRLLEQNLSSQLHYDQANAELKSSKAAVQQARDNLRYTILKAPFDGIVARVNIENHQPVIAQTPIIEFRHVNGLDIRFSVPETLLAKLKKVEDPAEIDRFCGEVTVTAQPEKSYRACHKEHETEPDELTRNYSALFKLDPVEEFVAWPGMTATIKLDFTQFLAEQTKQKVFAPVEAVFAEKGKKWIWLVKNDMTTTRKEVEVGRIEGNHIEIISDLDPESKIVAAGVSYVREGMLVKPMIKQRGL
jgi:RND family efflux transporter MFP subunit